MNSPKKQNNQWHYLFKQYCNSLIKGSINSGSGRSKLFNNLIDYWKPMRPIGIDQATKARAMDEIGFSVHGDLAMACSLHNALTLALEKHYQDIRDDRIFAKDPHWYLPKNYMDIFENPQTIDKYYPNGHARPIFAANFFNHAAASAAKCIVRNSTSELESADEDINRADKLVPDNYAIKDAKRTLEQIRTNIDKRKKQQDDEYHRRVQRKKDGENLKKFLIIAVVLYLLYLIFG